MLVIGLCGKKGSGKDTFADYLVDRYHFKKISFAEPLKEVCRSLFMLSELQCSDPIEKEVMDPRWGLSPRQLFQMVGTDWVRNQFHPDFWVQRMKHQLESFSEDDRIVVSDIRFRNEKDLIQSYGVTCGIRASFAPSVVRDVDTHISETQVDDFFSELDVIIENNDMGIPTFFRSILKNNRKVIQGATAGVLEVDYFFMDFNSIIYKEWSTIPQDAKMSLTPSRIETLLIKRVVERTKALVNNVVQPKEMTYLSFDGPAPKAKMVQQRSRRYKSVQTSLYLQQAKRQMGLEVSSLVWDPSSHICPGTSFMSQLSSSLQKSILEGGFIGDVTLSDSNVPGEGEHKILPMIRKMNVNPTQKDKTVVVYSPDGDMISLGLMTHKSHMYILRYLDADSEYEQTLLEKGFELLYCSLDAVRHDFRYQLSKTYKHVEEHRVLLDYNFLLAMVGNDFVPSLPFLKIRSGGLEILIDIYNRLRPKYSDYLVCQQEGGFSLHTPFFIDIVSELATMETREMRKENALIEKEYHGFQHQKRIMRERSMSAYEVFESRYYHMCLFHPDHPLSSQYRHLWNKIDYRQDKHVWKFQYYSYFCGFEQHSYNEERTEMVKNYLESLMFTLRYYTEGCPSWRWHYRYRVAPIPSDVLTVLSKFRYDPNSIVFERGKPYTPFQQLMMILPLQSFHILPKPFRDIAESDTWRLYYPLECSVDALAGMKYIYSEALLPECFDECELIRNMERIEQDKLTTSERKRNSISTHVKQYTRK